MSMGTGNGVPLYSPSMQHTIKQAIQPVEEPHDYVTITLPASPDKQRTTHNATCLAEPPSEPPRRVQTNKPVLTALCLEPKIMYARHAHIHLSSWRPGGASRLSSLTCPRLAEMRCPCGTLLHHHLHHTRPHQGPLSVGCACCRAACTCLALASGRSGGWSCGPFQPPCRTHWSLKSLPGPDIHSARPGEGPCSTFSDGM
jgi:hypothetical protein